MTREEAIKYLKQLYPNGGHCWLDEQRIEAIGIAISAIEFKEKVRAEIERRMNELYNKLPNGNEVINGTVTIPDANITGKYTALEGLLSFIDSMQLEEIPPKFPLISQKKCMYTKDNFTDEDRKVLCDGCEEDCKYAQKEEPYQVIDNGVPQAIHKEWLTPDQAKKAVEIAREEMIEWIDVNYVHYLDISAKGTLTANIRQLIDDLKQAMKDE